MATNQTFVDYQTPIPADWLNNVNNKVNILANKGTNIASAAAINLGAATGDYVVITGTTTITSLGTADAGTERTLVFSGVLTLTHNATSLILPGGADIVTDVGDIATFRSEGSGNWRCTGYQPNINGLKSNLPLSFSVGGAERMRFDTSGNVGIGGVPTAKFEVFGSASTRSSTDGYVYFATLNNAAWSGANYDRFEMRFDTVAQNFYLGCAYGGTGQPRALTFVSANQNVLKVDASYNTTHINPNGGLGYGIGAGGTVTQSTSKSTAVTLNKPCGQITMNNAALAAGASVSFQVNNTLVLSTDTVVVTAYNNANYRVEPMYVVGGGNFSIRVTNVTGGSLAEALQINFAIIKGATS